MWVTCGRSLVFCGTLVSTTNKIDCHDIAEILLKVALKTITLTLIHFYFREHLGIDPLDNTVDLTDPVCDAFYKNFYLRLATVNSSIYDKVCAYWWYLIKLGGGCGYDRMVVGFTTSYAFNAHHH